MLHEWLTTWFHWVEAWGYWGVFVLMAMESSILPVPSEIVMPPAAFWAAQGKMSFSGVVLAGTAGSYIGSILNYWAARAIGFPLVRKYGKYFLFPEQKLVFAEDWVKRYGLVGIFLARLLPVIRHLISIPAGLFRMRVVPFSIVTTIGAGLWCWILAWFGERVLGGHPELLDSPEAMISAIKGELWWFIVAAVGFTVLYGVVVWFRTKNSAQEKASAPLGSAPMI